MYNTSTSLAAGSLAVVLAHMQEGCLNALFPWTRERMVQVQAVLLRQCAELDVPLAIYIAEGCGAIHPRLERIIKSIPRVMWTDIFDGNFHDGSLDAKLRHSGASALFIAGVYADRAVESVVSNALLRKYRVATALDAIANPWRRDPFSSKNRGWLGKHCTALFRRTPQLQK